MIFIHAMIRAKNLEETINFWTEVMGLEVTKQKDYDEGRFTLAFLKDKHSDFVLEITYNWDQQEDYLIGRNFGHFAFAVDDIYAFCNKLIERDITINRPPRDGYMTFFKDPNGISIEILQKGEPLPVTEPWTLMDNEGTW